MALNKIEYFVGYNQLRQILEQERQNWLMKTDKIVEKQRLDMMVRYTEVLLITVQQI